MPSMPYFNPRSHKGSDGYTEKMAFDLCISIHAPTRGATRADIDAALSTQDFNPRSHKGSDDGQAAKPVLLRNFNPRSHKGSDDLKQR